MAAVYATQGVGERMPAKPRPAGLWAKGLAAVTGEGAMWLGQGVREWRPAWFR